MVGIILFISDVTSINKLFSFGSSSIFNKALGEIKSNKVPIFSIFEGIAILIAGAFLLTPGFLTDTLGCVLLVPKARNIIINYITSYLKKRTIYKEKTMYNSNEEDKKNKIFEGTFEEVDDNEKKK